MIRNSGRWFVAIASLFTLASTSVAQAGPGVSLISGAGAVNTPGEAYPVGSATFIGGASITVPLSQPGNPNISGTLTEEVWRENGTGTLDFLYQIKNNSPAANGLLSSLANFQLSSFGGGTPFLTSVDYATNAAAIDGLFIGNGQGSVAATRSSDGASVTFSFDPAGGPQTGLPSGNTSAVLFIATNATAYNQFGVATINGEVFNGASNGGNSFTGIFEPTVAAVPEPASIVLCGLAGLIGAGVYRSRKRSV
jgi:hypothetical protein